ncbi:MAG: chloride channel protein [Thiohalomonadaceae bacterium]
MQKQPHTTALERLRLKLARADALIQLSILGVLCGLLAGLVIIVFRFSLEQVQAWLLTSHPEDYERLGLKERFLIPAIGGVLLGALFQWLRGLPVGVVHVMERLDYHQAVLPWRNAAAQFAGALLSIAAGHSVGREGPAIHLGAWGGSLLGRWLTLPGNSLRTLAGCGVAAAIGASFNTPLAGVVFAMEVVLMEYTITGFAPVILASVSGTALTRIVYGPMPAFVVPPLELGSVAELPYVLVIGVLVGGLAAAFVRTVTLVSTYTRTWPVSTRLSLAGVLTGAIAALVPEIMGIGYDSVSAALLGQLGLFAMLGIVVAKLVATTVGIGLGLPGGLIGPTLVIGAAAGGAMGLIANALFPGVVSSHGFYAVVGMVAMMGATLQAPLAALMAMLELTANPHILLPGMLAVIAAGLTSSEGFRQGPLFVSLLRVRGLDTRDDPVHQRLRRRGVEAVVEHRWVRSPARLSRPAAEALLAAGPRWLVVQDATPPFVLATADLARALTEAPADEDLDLGAIPAADRLAAVAVPRTASLLDALEAMNAAGADAAYLVRSDRQGKQRVSGVVPRQAIEAEYRYNDRRH